MRKHLKYFFSAWKNPSRNKKRVTLVKVWIVCLSFKPFFLKKGFDVCIRPFLLEFNKNFLRDHYTFNYFLYVFLNLIILSKHTVYSERPCHFLSKDISSYLLTITKKILWTKQKSLSSSCQEWHASVCSVLMDGWREKNNTNKFPFSFLQGHRDAASIWFVWSFLIIYSYEKLFV